MFHVYSRNCDGGISEIFAAETRWECQKWVRARVGHNNYHTAAYVISSLSYQAAFTRYRRDR